MNYLVTKLKISKNLRYRKTRLNLPQDKGKMNFWKGGDYGVKIGNEDPT